MIIPIEDAIAKYGEYIEAVNNTKELLEQESFKIAASNDFELGAEWSITYKGKLIAEMMWNIPYMLSFSPQVEQDQEEFFVDYIKNIEDWREFLSDISQSIIAIKKDIDFE